MQPTDYTDYTKLSAKDIEVLLITVSHTAAKLYLTDIKKQFDIKTVLFIHFKQYFKITQLST
jgi:hypothetical protein